MLVGNDVDVTVNAGASTSLVFQYDDYHRKLIIDPREFTGGDVTTTTDSITIKDHNIETGQKIIHTSEGPAEGLVDNRIYYAVKVDKNTIKLSDTYYNSIQGIPETVGIGTTGIGGTIKPINPPIEVYRDATVTFTLADGSLAYTVQGTQYSAFQLNFYKDSEFAYQYDKNDLEKNFNVQRSGQVGIDGTAKVTLTVNKDTPKLLYYKLDPIELSSLPTVKSEINVDTEVDNNNQFETKTSLYDGTFRVSSGIGNTQFSYSVSRIPEKSSYLSTDNAFITYNTNSTDAVGPIAEVEIKDGGKNYYTLPGITTITTGGGKNAILEPSSKSIGVIRTNKINKIGFDLSVDKTVRPSVSLPNIIEIKSFASFDSIGISSQGRGYSAAPHLVVLDGKDDTVIDDVDLKYTLQDNSVKILKNTYGMNNVPPRIVPTANTNGVGISTVGFNTITKYATVTLDVGFSTANTFPFVVGDKVLIEGVSVGVGSTGKGFNSSAYNYKLFTITSTDPNIGGVGATVSYSLDGDYKDGEIVGLYDDQNSGGRIIAEKTFPIFTPQIKHNDYAVGEIVESDTTSGTVEAWDSQNGLLKVSTTDDFVFNERIKEQDERSSILQAAVQVLEKDKKAFETEKTEFEKEQKERKAALERKHDEQYKQKIAELEEQNEKELGASLKKHGEALAVEVAKLKQEHDQKLTQYKQEHVKKLIDFKDYTEKKNKEHQTKKEQLDKDFAETNKLKDEYVVKTAELVKKAEEDRRIATAAHQVKLQQAEREFNINLEEKLAEFKDAELAKINRENAQFIQNLEKEKEQIIKAEKTILAEERAKETAKMERILRETSEQQEKLEAETQTIKQRLEGEIKTIQEQQLVVNRKEAEYISSLELVRER